MNGDACLGVSDRLCYLWRNAIRNCSPIFSTFTSVSRWQPGERTWIDHATASPSPGRVLAETFILEVLPTLLRPGVVNILEIGCGSGRMRNLLERAGYSGYYTGIDLHDRFDHGMDSTFIAEYRQTDAHDIEPEPRFDLVLSNSALEHIEDDIQLIDRLRGTLHPGGIQLHIVPAGAALYAYLWHGYRQYPSIALERRFNSERTSIYALGGFASLCVHIGIITGPELLFHLPLRRFFPRFYRTCARAALQLDRFLPFGTIMHAVCERTSDNVE